MAFENQVLIERLELPFQSPKISNLHGGVESVFRTLPTATCSITSVFREDHSPKRQLLDVRSGGAVAFLLAKIASVWPTLAKNRP